MDIPAILALSTGVLSVAGFIAIVITRIVMKADERKLELKLRLKQVGDADTNSVIAELRAEIAALRETSSQYDLSLDHTMHRLERRIEFLEGEKRGSVKTSSQETKSVQRIGQNL